MRVGSTDRAVQGTNDDAQISKASCVRLGYFEDDYLRYFVRKGTAKRAPLINRGYYARRAVIQQLISQFLHAGQPGDRRQIICLGAGYDTTWFNLKDSNEQPFRYFEVDFPEVVQKKLRIVQDSKELRDRVALSFDSGVKAEKLVTDDYVVLPGDLREADVVWDQLKAAGLESSLPTLIIAECVLVYMPPEDSANLINKLGSNLSTAAFLVYEQIKPYDAFGKQMMINLQKERFTNHNWQKAWAKSMQDIYYNHITPLDRRRIERLEIFDEMEEWHLIQEHYCIAMGINDCMGLLEDFHLPKYS